MYNNKTTDMLYCAKIYNVDEQLVLDECLPSAKHIPELNLTIVAKLTEGEGIFSVDFERDPYESAGKHVQIDGEYVKLRVPEREGLVFKPSKYHKFTVYVSSDDTIATQRLTFKQALAVILPSSAKHIQECVFFTTRKKWRALYKKYIEKHEGGIEKKPGTLPREDALRYALRLLAWTKQDIEVKAAKYGIKPVACEVEFDHVEDVLSDSASDDDV